MVASSSAPRASTSRRRRHAGVALAGILLVTACSSKETSSPSDAAEEPSALAEDGTDAADAETDAELVTTSLISATAARGSLTLASTGELTADALSTAGLGDGAKAIYFPRNCLAVTSDEAAKTVRYDFKDCSGPNAIFKIRGVITATYAVSASKLTLNLVGSALRINRATVDWSATAEITDVGGARSMQWKGSLSGRTARGKVFSRTNDKLLTWRLGERCLGVSGVSEGTVRDRYLKTETTDYRRCQGACPEAGGRITISSETKLKVEITFNGGSRATYTTARGTTTFALACQS